MNKRRWNSLKVGDLLMSRAGKRFVVVGLKRAKVGPTQSNRVLSLRLARFLDAQDPDQWRVCTKEEVANET